MRGSPSDQDVNTTEFDPDRIGVSTNLLDHCTSLADSLEAMSRDFRSIEIELDHEVRRYLDTDVDHQAEIERIVDLQRRHGLRLSIHAPYTGRTTDIASLDEDERAAAVALMIRSIQFAARINATKVTIHPGYHPRDRQPRSAEQFAQITRSMATLAEHAHRHGIRLCVENTGTDRPNYIVLTHEQHVKLCEQFETYMTLDLIHYTSFSGMDNDYFTRLSPLLPHVANVHFADMDVPEHIHIPLGTGTLPYHEIVHFMSGAGYRGNYIVEERGKKFTEAEYLSAAADYRRSLMDAA